MSSAQSEQTSSTESPTLALPAPTDENAKKLDVESGTKVHLDDLGPMVVNSDGTLSRIANWPNMTEAERANTLRVLGARNKLRLAERKDMEAH
ncbi:hypothetical protein GYMLUDRAFT_39393 [Collybiopsis luxurians FD-317 M1]|nr:hypothetical protein GYMLUDRAFT_39393 [Collybiopsis luxurians FD-317 M1]